MSLERKLDPDPEYAELYYKEMDRMISCGYEVEVQEVESNKRHWYLPHFGIQNPNKPGRIRIVMDAAAKTNGISSNEQLLIDPDLLQSLIGVIMRFRQGRVAIQGDIKDMFLKIKMNEEDRDSQRDLWRRRNWFGNIL